MSEPTARWDRFWFAPVSPWPAAAFRALMGGYLFFYFLSLAPYVTVYFSDAGVYLPYRVPDYAPGPLIAWAIYLATLACAVLLAIGYRARWMARITLALFLYHYLLSLAIQHCSYDRLIIIYLVVLCFLDSDAVWAVSARPDREASTPAWGGRLIRFQMVMLYLGAGLWKVVNPRWQTGEMLWAHMQGMWASPLGLQLTRLGLSGAVWDAITRGVYVAQILLALAFLAPRTRPVAVAVGLGFHLFNTTFLFVPQFLVAPLTYVFFVRPEAVEAALRAVSRRLRRPSPAHAPARSPRRCSR